MEPIRILIADDNENFRLRLRATLRSVSDIEVVGEAATGAEATELAERLQPDVVLMDVRMPGQNGIDATARVVQTSPHIGVVVLTTFEDDNLVFAGCVPGPAAIW
jgi:DNA-binding NarL/FixJ family response regulator